MKTRSLHHMKGLLQPFVLAVGIRGVGSLELLAGLLVQAFSIKSFRRDVSKQCSAVSISDLRL
jgi:hypothetical protein